MNKIISTYSEKQETKDEKKILVLIAEGMLEGFGASVSGSFENCLKDDEKIISQI